MMNKKFRVNFMVTALFLLLGLGLRFVPGIRFSSNLCFGLAGVSLVEAGLKLWSEKSPVGKWCKRIFLVGLAGVILVLGCAETVIIRHGEEDLTALPVDAVIVLGAGVNGTVPSLTLRTRIDAAEAYLKAHPEVPAVLSGGQGPGEDITEARCMFEALVARGIDPERLILEERSTSTAQNFHYSMPLLEERGLDSHSGRLAIVTNDFHMLRAKLLVGSTWPLETVGVPAELPWWWLSANYYVREAFALIKTLIFD